MDPTWQQPMQNAIAVSWNVNISQDDFEKIQNGFEPWQTIDRWNVQAMRRDESTGNVHIQFIRTWSETPIYTLVINPGCMEDNRPAEIKRIMWEKFEDGAAVSEDWAKREVVLVARSFMECDLPGLPELSLDEWYPRFRWYRLHNWGANELPV